MVWLIMLLKTAFEWFLVSVQRVKIEGNAYRGFLIELALLKHATR